MGKPEDEQKPMFSFKEKDLSVTFDLVMPGLKCSRKITKLLKMYPEQTNAKVLDKNFTEQSINYSIKVQSTMFRFQIERLPSPIKADKVKIEYTDNKVTLKLTKQSNEPWSNYAEYDYETKHLVQN